MRISLLGVDTPVTDDQRAYAEYRFFRALARHEALVRAVTVAVRYDAAANRSCLCTITVDLSPSGTVRTQARAPHPTAAIDRAAERTAWLLERRATTTAGCEVVSTRVW